MRTRNFTIFTVYATTFGLLVNLWRLFIFSNYIGEIHLTLEPSDLLKRSDTWRWTFWKVSICGPFERRPQWTRVYTLDYRQNPGPTVKFHLSKRSIHYNWSIIKYGRSILELLEIFSKVIALNCGPVAMIQKQAIFKKQDLLKRFSKVREAHV